MIQKCKRGWARRDISRKGEARLGYLGCATEFDDCSRCSRFCKGAKREPFECLCQLSDTETTMHFLEAFSKLAPEEDKATQWELYIMFSYM